MKKLGYVLAATALSTQAIAHEGHGVDASSVFHYLSAPHLIASIGIVVSVVGISYLILKSRRQNR